MGTVVALCANVATPWRRCNVESNTISQKWKQHHFCGTKFRLRWSLVRIRELFMYGPSTYLSRASWATFASRTLPHHSGRCLKGNCIVIAIWSEFYYDLFSAFWSHQWCVQPLRTRTSLIFHVENRPARWKSSAEKLPERCHELGVRNNGANRTRHFVIELICRINISIEWSFASLTAPHADTRECVDGRDAILRMIEKYTSARLAVWKRKYEMKKLDPISAAAISPVTFTDINNKDFAHSPRDVIYVWHANTPRVQ